MEKHFDQELVELKRVVDYEDLCRAGNFSRFAGARGDFDGLQGDRRRNFIQEELWEDYMMKDPSTSSRALPLLLIARHLERICDLAANIAEEVIYLLNAKVAKHHPELLRPPPSS